MGRRSFFSNREREAIEVIPGLYIGAAPSRRLVAKLSRAGVSHVVDLRIGPTGVQAPWPRDVTVETHSLTEFEAPSVEALRRIARRGAELLAGGSTVFIHCREGIQRAPMVACAVLMESRWTLADAFRIVSARRPMTAMTEAQLQVLREFEATRDTNLSLR